MNRYSIKNNVFVLVMMVKSMCLKIIVMFSVIIVVVRWVGLICLFVVLG